MSGKTLFIKSFLAKHRLNEFVMIPGRDPKVLKKASLEKIHALNTTLYFTDVNMKIKPEAFIPVCAEIGESKMIIEYILELKSIPDECSFKNRFDVINTNTISYKDLINFLNTK